MNNQMRCYHKLQPMNKETIKHSYLPLVSHQVGPIIYCNSFSCFMHEQTKEEEAISHFT